MNSGINLAKKIILSIDKGVRRIYWTNQEIDKWFAKRSAKEIINNGHTCFMNPCSDLTFVTSFILSLNNLPHEWIIEEILPTKKFNFNRLHFALEFNLHDKLYVIDYKRNNEVYVFKGNYNRRENLPIKQIIRFPDDQIDLEKSLYENINNSNLKSYLKDYSLKENINKLKRDNSPENYKRFKRLFGENLIIKQL